MGAGGCEGRGDLLRDEAGLPHAGDHDAAGTGEHHPRGAREPAVEAGRQPRDGLRFGADHLARVVHDVLLRGRLGHAVQSSAGRHSRSGALSTTSAAAPSPRRLGDETGLDAARPRPYLNEPSFSRDRRIVDPFDAEIGHVQARDSRSNDKRGRILDAAIRVFAERGFHSATVAEIARAAGVADGTIYLYFKGKDDLLLRLFDEKMTGLVAEVKAALAQERSAAEKLKRFIQLHLALVERNPDLAAVLIVGLRQSAQFLKAADRQKLAAYLDLIAEVVRAGPESGETDRNISPATVKRAIFGALDELALGWLLGGRRAALKKTAAEVAEWLVRGLLPADGGTS